jgi:hypothetical protein
MRTSSTSSCRQVLFHQAMLSVVQEGPHMDLHKASPVVPHAFASTCGTSGVTFASACASARFMAIFCASLWLKCIDSNQGLCQR